MFSEGYNLRKQTSIFARITPFAREEKHLNNHSDTLHGCLYSNFIGMEFLGGISGVSWEERERRISPLQLGSQDQIFSKRIYIMGYNIKHARNRKSMSKITIRPSLRLLALKSKV